MSCWCAAATGWCRPFELKPWERHGAAGREAPGVELRVVALRDEPGSDLASGKLDVVLMPRMRKVRASAAARFWKSASSVLRGASIAMLWHERTHSDPARRWLRDVIVTEATKRSRTPTSVQARAPRRPVRERRRQTYVLGEAMTGRVQSR
jgi:hypothetical protein